jgi:DMSO/TMAO reductase YedYZ heme-binding membrane subunit
MLSRTSLPGFSLERLERAAFASDSAPVEVWFGGWIIILRGVMLAIVGFTYGAIADLLGSFGMTNGRLGFLLVACGVAQILAAGTQHLLLRAAVAFAGSVLCLAVFLAYIGQDLEHTSMAWSWGALMIAETALCWRILLWRRALEVANDPR